MTLQDRKRIEELEAEVREMETCRLCGRVRSQIPDDCNRLSVARCLQHHDRESPHGRSELLALDELFECLREMVYETTHLSPRNDDGSHTCKISAKTLDRARAALRARFMRNVEIDRG